MNVANSLKTGWEIHVNNIISSWESDTTSNINHGCGTNITSKEGSACTQPPRYILSALQLSNTRRTPNDLRDDLMCPITRGIFKDSVMAGYGNTYE